MLAKILSPSRFKAFCRCLQGHASLTGTICTRTYHGQRTNAFFEDIDHEEIVNRSKYRRGDKSAQRMISDKDIHIPSSEIRQFIKNVHPDRFQVFIAKHRDGHDTHYTVEQLQMMQRINQSNLSTFNSILEFSRKHAKLIQSELLQSSKKANDSAFVQDRKLAENAPHPSTLEFYIEKNVSSEPASRYFEHVLVKFDCKEDKPSISNYFGALYTTLNALFESCGISAQSVPSASASANHSGGGDRVKKFSDLELDKAIKMANTDGENVTELMDEAMRDHLCGETQQRHQLHGVNAIKYKLKRKQIYFAATLNSSQTEAALDMLYRVSSEYAVDLVFDLWMDVPIVVCEHEMECLNCPDYVVSIPWYCDPEEFVLYIQEQIVDINEKHKAYRKYMHRKHEQQQQQMPVR